MGTQLRLDGSDDAITTTYVPVITTGLSIAFWFNPAGFVANQRIVDWQVGGPADGFTILTASGTAIKRLAFRCSNVGTGICDLNSPDLNLHQWYHVVCTYAPNSMKMYIDSVEVASDTAGTMTTSAAVFSIGKRATAASNFPKCFLDEFIVVERALTQTEITDLYTKSTVPATPALVYQFDEGTMENSGVSNVITDSSGNGNHGTHAGGIQNQYVNNHPLAERFAPLPGSYGLSFGGNSTDRVNCGTDSSLTDFGATNQLTFEAWVFIRSHPNVLPRVASAGPHYICFMGDSTNGKYRMLALEVQNEGASSIHEYWGNTQLEYQRWYHVAATFNATTKQGRIYVNGLEDNTDEIRAVGAEWTGNLADTVSPFMIGNSSSGSNDRVTHAIIKNVKAYNRELTRAEIYARAHSNVRITDGLVGEWLGTEGSGATLADTSGEGNTGTITGATWVNPEVRSVATGRTAAAARQAA